MISGKLTYNIVPYGTLADTIVNIKKHLSLINEDLILTHDQPQYYYQNPSFVVIRRHDNVYVTLKLPVSSPMLILSLYKVISYPIPSIQNASLPIYATYIATLTTLFPKAIW